MNKAVKQLALGAWRTVLPKNARNSLRLWLMTELPDRAPQLIEKFAVPSLVVLAPHMDDEIIGPGGTVARHVQSGSAVTFIYMSDGLAGEPNMATAGLSPDEIRRRKHAYAQGRKDESRRAAQIVGVKELVFLDGPDGALADTPEMVAALAQALEQRRPALIYAPALTDGHRDHWGTNRILHQALNRLPQELLRDLILRGYEVWTPAPANRMADITPVIDLKKRAIDAFVSQTRLVDYAHAIIGLNQYRSMVHLLGRGYAEAFLETTVEEYRKIFARISLKNPAA